MARPKIVTSLTRGTLLYIVRSLKADGLRPVFDMRTIQVIQQLKKMTPAAFAQHLFILCLSNHPDAARLLAAIDHCIEKNLFLYTLETRSDGDDAAEGEADCDYSDVLKILTDRSVIGEILPQSEAAIKTWERNRILGQIAGTVLLIGGFAVAVLGVGGQLEWVIEAKGITTKLANAGLGAVGVVSGFLLLWHYKAKISLHRVVRRRIRLLEAEFPQRRVIPGRAALSPTGYSYEEEITQDDELHSDVGSIVLAALASLGASSAARNDRRIVWKQEEIEGLEEEQLILARLHQRSDLATADSNEARKRAWQERLFVWCRMHLDA